MGILSVLLNRKNVSQKATVSVLGPSKAGKTTLIRYLETGIIEEDPDATKHDATKRFALSQRRNVDIETPIMFATFPIPRYMKKN